MPYRYLFGSDITAASASTIALNYGTDHIFFSDCTNRKMCDVPEVDLYHAGFPCQPFSTAGKNMGVADTRGRVLHHVLKYITQKRPPLVLLENVKGLVIRHADVMNHVCSTMRRHGYFVTYKVLNACHQGVAHNRERVLILGFLAVGAKTSFDWPTNIATPPATLFLDPLKPSEHFTNLPPASQTLARKHVEQALAETRLRKIDPAVTPVIVDVDGSKCHWMRDCCPCLTRSRASNGGHWLLLRGRRLSVTEQERLMGYHIVPPSGGHRVRLQRPADVSIRSWGALLGNSIPVPLLARTLCRALPAASLSGPLPDVWQPRQIMGVLRGS